MISNSVVARLVFIIHIISRGTKATADPLCLVFQGLGLPIPGVFASCTSQILCGTGVGVTCNANNQALSLQYTTQGLSGSIVTNIGSLTALKLLDLSFNALVGPLPTQLGNLRSVSSLNLNSNTLSGPIPTELGQLTNLAILNLAGNNLLTGDLPSQLCSLNSLQAVFLSGDSQLGNIPSCIVTSGRVYLGGTSVLSSSPTAIPTTIPTVQATTSTPTVNLLAIPGVNLDDQTQKDGVAIALLSLFFCAAFAMIIYWLYKNSSQNESDIRQPLAAGEHSDSPFHQDGGSTLQGFGKQSWGLTDSKGASKKTTNSKDYSSEL